MTSGLTATAATSALSRETPSLIGTPETSETHNIRKRLISETDVGEDQREYKTAEVNPVLVSGGLYGSVVLGNGCWGRARPQTHYAACLAVFDPVTFCYVSQILILSIVAKFRLNTY